MYRLPIVRLLLSPSLLSGALTLAAAMAAVLTDIWAFVRHSTVFNEYLFGPYGARTLLVREPDHFAPLRLLLDSMVVYYVLLVVVALSAGLAVYALLQMLGRARRSTADLLQGLHSQRAEQVLQRLGLRLFVLLAWGVYMVFFLVVLAPAMFVWAESGADRFATTPVESCLLIAAAVLLLAAGLHLHVVFARLSLLRLRVFGGDDLTAEYDRYLH